MPAPSPVLPSASTAPRCQTAFSAAIAASTTWRRGWPSRAAMTPTPQASCSSRGSYRPLAARWAALRRYGSAKFSVIGSLRRCLQASRLQGEIAVDLLRRIAPVADRPDDEGSTPHDVAGGEHAIEIGHHAAVVDLQRAPAGDRQIGRLEHPRNVLGVEAQGLQHQIGVEIEMRTLDGLGRLAARGLGQTQMDALGAHAADLAFPEK